MPCLRFTPTTVFLLAILCTAQCFGDTDRIPCDSLDGWSLLDSTGGKARPVLSVGPPREGSGSVQLVLERVAGGAAALVRPCVLIGVQRIQFFAWTAQPTPLLLTLEDQDGARFHALRQIPAGVWTRVSVPVEDFGLAPDSPVKKPRLDTLRLGLGFGVLDAAGVLGRTGSNTVRIDDLHIERAELPPAALPDVIDGVIEIKSPAQHTGNLVVRKGGVLCIHAPRFVFDGSISLEGGALELAEGTFTFAATYTHQRKITLSAGSRVTVRDAVLANHFIPSFEVKAGATLDLDRMTALGVATSISVNGGSVTARRCRCPGEFMIFPKATVLLEDTTMALLWVMLGDNAKGTVAFPDGARIDDWALAPGLDIGLTVRRGTEIRWGLITAPGADVTVEKTHYTAAGITLWGSVALDGIRNGDPSTGERLTLPDRRVILRDTRVDVWNIYAAPGCTATLRNCRLGEIWSMGDARLTLIDSECDGTGGYVSSLQGSTFRLVNCTLDAEVIAQDDSTLILEQCRVNRAVSASGRALLQLAGSPTPTPVNRVGEARVEVK